MSEPTLTKHANGTYSLPPDTFDRKDCEELEALGFDPFTPMVDDLVNGTPLTRGQWLALAEMALGKATRIRKGDYGPCEEDLCATGWALQLERISSTILSFFKSGDGNT